MAIKFNQEVIEIDISGKPVRFKYNMAALTLFGDYQNASLQELIEQISGKPRLSTISNFLYAGYVTCCKQEKHKIEYTQDDACEWVNELGIDKALLMLINAFDIPSEVKN